MKTATAKKVLSFFIFLFTLLLIAYSSVRAQSYGEYGANPFFNVPDYEIQVGKTFREILTTIDAVPPGPTAISSAEKAEGIMALDHAVIDTTTWESFRTKHFWERKQDSEEGNHTPFRIDNVCDYETIGIYTIDKQAVMAYVERLGFTRDGDLVKQEHTADHNGKTVSATFLLGYTMDKGDYYIDCHIVEYHDQNRFGWIYLQIIKREI